MRRLVAGLLVACAACHGELMTAPETPELSCANAITPPTFRTVRGVDTTAWTNRYIIPHHYADTVHVGGDVPFDVIGQHGGRCTLLSDSLIIWNGGAKVIP